MTGTALEGGVSTAGAAIWADFDDDGDPDLAAAAGDVDGDGDLDLYVGHLGATHDDGHDRIFLNDGRGRFALDPRFLGPLHTDISTGAAFADFDGDGDLDLLSTSEGEGIGLWINDGRGGYVAATDTTLLARRDDYSSIATGDLDGDGDVDAVLGNWGESHEGAYATVLTNASVSCGQPVRVELRDRGGSPDGAA